MTDAAKIKAMPYPDLRNWWVQQHGWTIYTEGLPVPHYLAPGKHPDADCQLDHPLPDTLDAVAGLLPEGLSWRRQMIWTCSNRSGDSLAFVSLNSVGDVAEFVPDTGDEKCDRLRLACLALVAMRSNKQ